MTPDPPNKSDLITPISLISYKSTKLVDLLTKCLEEVNKDKITGLIIISIDQENALSATFEGALNNYEVVGILTHTQQLLLDSDSEDSPEDRSSP